MRELPLPMLSMLFFLLLTAPLLVCGSLNDAATRQRDAFTASLVGSAVDAVDVDTMNSDVVWRPSELLHATVATKEGSLGGNVYCGGGYCPTLAPICCGGPSAYFCVAGGVKCCSAAGGRVAAACGQNAVCCSSSNNATCCKSGEVCRVESNVPSCISDTCTMHQTADGCFNSTSNCSWCCSDRRCVSKHDQCSSKEALIGPGQKCPSRCQYADTCNLCMAYNNNTILNDEPCQWCCGSQSCVSAQGGSLCENGQSVTKTDMCSACQANGEGLNPHFVGTAAQFFAMLAGVVLVFGILSCLGVVRCYLYFRGNSLLSNGMRVADAEAHLEVRRHGFDVSGPVSAHSRPLTTLKKFWQTVRKTVFEANKLQNTEHEDVPSVHGMLRCSECRCMLRVSTLAAVANLMKGVKPTETKTEKANLTSGIQVPHTDGSNNDDDVVILLPCSHLFCYLCMGLETTQSSSSCTLNSSGMVSPSDDTDAIREKYIRSHLSTEESTPSPQLQCQKKQEQEQEQQKQQQRKQSPALESQPRKQQQQQQEQQRQATGSNRETQTQQHQEQEDASPQTERSDSTTVSARAVTDSRHRTQRWGNGLLNSLRRLNTRRSSPTVIRPEDREKFVLESIKRRCPKCTKSVKDVLLPENILKL